MSKYLKKNFGVITSLVLTVVLLPAILLAQKATMHVSITGMRNEQGKILVTVFNSSKGFPASLSNAYSRQQLVIKNKKAWFDLELPPGDYALAVLHDENGNMQMDKKAFGLPKEGYGFSQNVMGTFGPPSFNKAAVHFPAQKSIEIRMKY